MNRILSLIVGLVLATPLAAQSFSGGLLDRLHLPAEDPAFIENRGQWPDDVAFLARLDGVDLWVTSGELVYDFYDDAPDYSDGALILEDARTGGRGRVVRVQFVGAREAHVLGRGVRTERYNYFPTSDRTRWATNVPIYEEVVLEELYDGIALRLHAEDGVLKQELVLSPGADPARVTLGVRGADGLNLGGDTTLDRAAMLGRPAAHVGPRARPEVGASQTENIEQRGTFLTYSRLIGGSDDEGARSLALGTDNSAYLTGVTDSGDFPTPNGFDSSLDGDTDAFLARVDAGGALSYGTYLGGNNRDDARGIAYANESVYITGVTRSSDFPTTDGAYDENSGDRNKDDVFVARIRANGSGPVFATFIGGGEEESGEAIAVSSVGNVVVGGWTKDDKFPVPSGDYEKDGDAYVLVLSSDGSDILGGTFIGGSKRDIVRAIRLGNNSIYAAGDTNSKTFGDLEGESGGDTDAFVVRLSNSAGTVLGGTFIGGSGLESATGTGNNDRTGDIALALGAGGAVYVAGGTSSSDFPSTSIIGSLGGTDVFVARLGPGVSQILGATLFGGGGTDRAYGLAVAPDGTVHVAGQTSSSDFPVLNADDDTYNGQGDAFVVKLAGNGSAILYGTYLGGSGTDTAFDLAVAANGFTYLAGETRSTSNFPTTLPTPHQGRSDVFVAAYDLRPNDPPIVENPISDATLADDAAPLVIDLGPVFSDPDDDALTYSCTSSAPGVATASGCSGGTLTVTPVAPGKATITVTASDGRNPGVATSFDVTVFDSNDPPVVQNPIANTDLALGGDPLVIDLDLVFSDPDGDALDYACQSSAPSVATATGCAGGTLTVSALTEGEATITVTAADPDNEEANDVFVVTVIDPNRPPVVDNPIADTDLALGGAPLTIDLDPVFSDPDGDALDYACRSSTPGVATVSGCAGGTLAVTAVSVGVTTVTVTATDPGGREVTDAFAVTVVNPAPVVTRPIPDTSLLLGSQPFEVDLDTVFADPNGDPLAFSFSVNSNAVLLALDGSVLSVTPDKLGTATVTVSASDGTTTTDEAFAVTVTDNLPPVVVDAPPDVTLTLGDEPLDFDLGNVFEDPEGNPLSFSCESDAPTVAAVGNCAGGTLTVTAIGAGEATITARASDAVNPGVPVSFVVTVVEANRAPIVQAPIQDLALGIGAPPFVAELGDVFADPDGDALTYTCQSSAPGVAAATGCAEGVLAVAPVSNGEATITIIATDPSGLSAEDVFVVSVVSNAPPTVQAPISDAALVLGGTPLTVTLSGVFEDPEGEALTYACQSSAPGVATTAGCSTGVLTVTAVSEGEATITVVASDPDEASAEDVFLITVVTTNSPPTVVMPIEDADLAFGGVPLVIELDAVFADPNGDALTYACQSSTPAVVSADCLGDTLTLTPEGEGEATITITAADPDGASVQDVFVATVVTENLAPIVEAPVADAALTLGGPPLTVDLGAVFVDPNGDALTYSCSSNLPDVVEASDCSGGMLTLTPASEGVATITLTAADPEGEEATDVFIVSIGCSPASIASVNSTPSMPEQGSQVSVSATVSGSGSAVLRYRRGGADRYETATMALSGGTYVATIPADFVTAQGVEYFVEVEQGCGPIARSAIAALQVRIPTGLSSPAFPAATEQTGYRLVSIPLLLEDQRAAAVLSDLGPATDTSWRLFQLLAPGETGDLRADGTEDQWYREAPASIDMAPGRAFWLISRDGGRFNSGAGTTLPSAEPLSLELHPGWNLVGTPFGYEIPLERSRLESGSPVQLQAYDGSWRNETATMQPFRGYALFSETEDRLVVDPPARALRAVAARGSSGGGTADAAALAPTDKAYDGWSVTINAALGSARDENNVALVTPSATEGRDASDWFEPPLIGEYVSVSFDPPEGRSIPLTVDARPVPTEGATWPLSLRSNVAGEAVLSFDGLERVPDEFVVWLVDQAAGTVRDLRREPRYAVTSPALGAPVRLDLVIGTESYAHATSGFDSTTPSAFDLAASYPNPFRSVTTIPFALPSAAHVVLEVFDVVGRKVATLVDGQLEAGFHKATWDGRPTTGRSVLASGVYIYRFRAGTFEATRRTVRVR